MTFHTISLALALAIALLSPAALATDVLVWTPKGDGHETRWVTVDGDKVSAVATRAEAVASDGKTLWALRIVTTELALHPCEDLDKEDGAKGEAEGTFDWPALQAEALVGGETHWVIDPPAEKVFFGEVWNEKITLIGGAGATVMLNHNNSGYGCGAHGYVDDAAVTWSLASKATVAPTKLVVDEATVRKAPVEALVKQAADEDCMEDEEMSRGSIYLDGLWLDVLAGAVSPTLSYIHPTGADWQFACTLEERVMADAKVLAASIQPSAAVTKALAALKISGTVGYATLSLTGEARAKALAAFQSKAGPPAKQRTWASAAAKPFVAKGRKLTKAKQYPAAIAAFDTAIRKDPTAARAWSGRGYAKLLAGQLDKAARDFDRALKLDATDKFHAAIWYNLGQVAEKQGKKAQARRAYGRSLKLNKTKGAAAALKNLK